METGSEGLSPKDLSRAREKSADRAKYSLRRFSEEKGRFAGNPFGSVESALKYWRDAVNSSEDIGNIMSATKIRLRKGIGVSVVQNPDYSESYFGDKNKYRLRVTFKGKHGAEDRVVDFGANIRKEEVDRLELSLKKDGYSLQFLKAMSPKSVIRKIGTGVERWVAPIASRIKQAGQVVAAAGLAGAVLAGGVYKGPEIASKIHLNRADRSEHVQKADKSIDDHYSALKDDRESQPTPEPSLQPSPPSANVGSTETPSNIEVPHVPVRDIVGELQRDGRENGYYFVDVGDPDPAFSSPHTKDGKRLSAPPAGIGPQLLFPAQISNDDGSVSFLVINMHGPRKATVSNDDARLVQALIEKTITKGDSGGGDKDIYPRVYNSIFPGQESHPGDIFTYFDVGVKELRTIGLVLSDISKDEMTKTIQKSRQMFPTRT